MWLRLKHLSGCKAHSKHLANTADYFCCFVDGTWLLKPGMKEVQHGLCLVGKRRPKAPALPSTSPLAAFLSPSATPPSTSGSRVHCVRLWGSTEVQTALASCLSEVTRTQSSRHRHRGSVGSIDAQYSLEEALHGRGGWEGSKDPGHLTVPLDGHSTAGVGTPHSTWTPRFPTSRK